ncbi:proline dehydrogenase family protein [Natronobacterium gregoryi]|uniref:Proline dehydrogenase n=2 Tax=Natronobacterium gregoryi TaxID=44930 RepID=L0AGZ8_NATGS|nr:proline dehydrogenase family protein [Natronobacterium gregoryi]AFZ72442.1 proline dehydrogenase [Natronobacterium gregoryi SP2]ELY74314.1 proline dehydrogenase [Natronobacterium gregoryi SP2]PLK21416.1 proline dehydrogenase [Natronobacterium gregoryi SP2]SFI78450.1 L-proline dehydrogenase [Natronobacterium gregoryi]
MLPPVANRFVAGKTAAEAIDHARRQAKLGIDPMINLLGSHHGDRATAVADAEEYCLLVEDLAAADLDGQTAISVKPTQLGLECDETLFRDLLADVIEAAGVHDVFVWLDMEEHTTVDATLDAYEEFARTSDARLGVCLQADLERTLDDLERLADVPGTLRLVKGGAYDRPTGIAYTTDPQVDRAYRRLLERAFETVEGTVAVASHDPAMIECAIDRADGTDLELQFLMGVRPRAQRTLAAEWDVRQFVPYGTRWKRWAINRAKRNVGFTARAVAETVVPLRNGETFEEELGVSVPVSESGLESTGE